MFTKRRFQGFPFEKQHKKCAEILKQIYESLLSNHSFDAFLEEYHDIQKWMGSEFELSSNLKTIADRYHYHLQYANKTYLEHNLLPSIRQGDREQSSEIWPISIYLDRLRSAHNVGSIIRTVEAFALGTLYFSEQTPYIDHKQVQNASMGAFQFVQCYKDRQAKDLPKPFIVMETSQNAIPLQEFIFPEVFTLAVGNEEYGCSDEILKLADHVIEIPLRGRKNSLNVANAFAIAASEIQRQRKEIP